MRGKNLEMRVWGAGQLVNTTVGVHRTQKTARAHIGCPRRPWWRQSVSASTQPVFRRCDVPTGQSLSDLRSVSGDVKRCTWRYALRMASTSLGSSGIHPEFCG